MLAPAPAAAAPFVEVEYDLGDSTALATIPAINQTTETPPHGSIQGRQTMRYAADSASGLVAGAVELLSFNLTVHATVGTSVYTAGGGKTFYIINTSDLHFEFLELTDEAQAAGGAGERRAGGTVDPLGAYGKFQVTGTLHCYRVCGAIPGAVTTSRQRIVTRQFTAPLPTLTGATGEPHTLYGSATGVQFGVGVEEGGVPVQVVGTTKLVGREVARTSVPEPSSLPLVAGGLVGLGLAAAGWRRRNGAMRSGRALVLVATPSALLALGVGAPPAQAASTVDVTYDLADSDLVWEFTFGKVIVSNDDDRSFPEARAEVQVPGIVSGSMKVSYASDSSSGMPIRSGAATLQTFHLSVESFAFISNPRLGPRLTATLRWQLTTPETGRLTSGGALTGLDVNLLMTGRADCKLATFDDCFTRFGLPTFTVYPSYSRSGAIELAGTPGLYAGTQSTRHTLAGRGRAIGWQPGAGILGLGYDFKPSPTFDDYGGAHLVGREILREADGHEPKVVPEPGTLLLLGAGTAGLALIRGPSRRSWVH